MFFVVSLVSLFVVRAFAGVRRFNTTHRKPALEVEAVRQDVLRKHGRACIQKVKSGEIPAYKVDFFSLEQLVRVIFDGFGDSFSIEDMILDATLYEKTVTSSPRVSFITDVVDILDAVVDNWDEVSNVDEDLGFSVTEHMNTGSYLRQRANKLKHDALDGTSTGNIIGSSYHDTYLHDASDDYGYCDGGCCQ